MAIDIERVPCQQCDRDFYRAVGSELGTCDACDPDASPRPVKIRTSRVKPKRTRQAQPV